MSVFENQNLPLHAHEISLDDVIEYINRDYRLDGPPIRRIEVRKNGFVINPQPAAVLDGDPSAMKYGLGPIVILRESGEVYELGSSTAQLDLLGLLDLNRFESKSGPIWSIKQFRNQAKARGVMPNQKTVRTA